MAATVHDVAAIAGVSIKTVSNVVNNFPNIRPATRAKVQAAIAELGYQPNLAARSLRSGRTGTIGLALPELSLPYFAELADAVIRAAERRGLVVLIEQTNGDRSRELAMLNSPRLKLTDGLLFSPLGMTDDDAATLNVTYPLVLLGERILTGPTDHVSMRNEQAAHAATAHLIECGRRRIAVIGARDGAVIGSAGLRLRGYRSALEEADIRFDPDLVVLAQLWNRGNGAAGMRELLARGVPFDALFGLNDTLTLGALRVLQEHDLKVPDDVAVIGFDNIDEAQFSLPSLSTIDPGRPEIAEIAVQLLADRIAGAAGPTEPRELLAQFQLIRRESTAVRDTVTASS
ncbi:DNA-binding LacI/PurR family transcriptional regulator [Nakamurella sp. UYEF19]|uniref:LacI family DNA-binding transcriptional regulator n=1 Tax=Nakamurella sp. UYEF19 TaxID=1756392 RepID=UPI003390A327